MRAAGDRSDHSLLISPLATVVQLLAILSSATKPAILSAANPTALKVTKQHFMVRLRDRGH